MADPAEDPGTLANRSGNQGSERRQNKRTYARPSLERLALPDLIQGDGGTISDAPFAGSKAP